MDQKQRATTGQGPIVVAVDDSNTHAEAVHLAAATGRQVIDVGDDAQLARHSHAAFAVLASPSRLEAVGHARNVFAVTGDLPSAEGQAGVYVLPAQAADLLRAIGALALTPAEVHSPGTTVAVVGAAGGAGASTLAAAVCRGAVGAGHTATLIDAHWLSGGLDLLLGLENDPGARWGEIEIGEGALSRDALRSALPTTEDGIAVLTFPRQNVADPYRLSVEELNRAVGAVATAGVTVVDASMDLLPARCDLAVIVLPAELRAAAAAARLVAECSASSIPHALILRDGGWSALSAEEIEHTTRSRVLGRIRTVRGLTRSVEQAGLAGHLPRHLATAAQAVLGEVA